MDQLLLLAEQIRSCTKCRLCETRTNAVPGEGPADARIVLVGEGPGKDEDLQGRPFVGASGKLLDRALLDAGLTRDAVYITNSVRCRPPDNRRPETDELLSCKPYLTRELSIIHPAVVVPLGNTATQNLLETALGITRLRGHEHPVPGFTFSAIPSWHPSAVLRDRNRRYPELVHDLILAKRLTN